MNRRRFLKVASFTAAVLSARKLVGRAFADESCVLPQVGAGLKQLSGALRRALEAGKPLLVIVIPADDGKKWERGRIFGELLNHGSAEQLAPLSLVEVACAQMVEVRALAPRAPDGEPLAILIDARQRRVSAVDGELPADTPYDRFGADGQSWEQRTAAEDALVDRRIARLAKLLRDGIPGADEAVARAREVAPEIRARLVKQRIPGSHWANASGCGTRVEDDTDALGVACGMGHVPSKSTRFLYLYAKTPGEQWREDMKKRQGG